jgi:ATP-binding cassette, subfamily B, bacterial
VGKFPFYKQLGAMDCGATSLKMIAKYYGKDFSINFLKKITKITKSGVSFLSISEAAEKIGLRSRGVKLDLEALRENEILPCIVHWNQNHFIVCYKVTKKYVFVSDPAIGHVKYSHKEFIEKWAGEGKVGVALYFQPTADFYKNELDDEEKEKPKSIFSLLNYIKGYRSYFIQLILGLLVGSAILMISPFLTQAIVDKGIYNKNLNFVYLILFAQFVMFIGNISVEVFRRLILLHIGTRVNISLISDFLLKLLNLAINFFETHLLGDIMQRITDHKRLESLLTVNSLNTVFSIINLILFGIILFIFDGLIFWVFLLTSLLSVGWMIMFLNKRKVLDHKFFEQSSKNTEKLYEIIKGVNEIKLSNSVKQKRWEWEEIQAKLFKVRLKILSLNQTQEIGASVINQFKNLIITFIAAKAVIDGSITLGAMFAITMIVGQLNSPFNQLLKFVLDFYDAKIAFKRIEEIKQEKDEVQKDVQYIEEIPENADIQVRGLNFKYEGSSVRNILNNLNLTIPSGKITAIVGASGSGKTTFLKLLLRFFEPQEGSIMLSNIDMKKLNIDVWRANIGVVLQDGMMFSDTIAANIALGESTVDMERVVHAAQVACIDDFVLENLPLGYHTKIGAEGLTFSKGQQQRILLARAVYKNPKYIFLDEATSALDTTNEKKVMENLDKFFENRTVVVIAHRLSTVRNAHQIIVLSQKGEIVEVGSHDELSKKKGYYYQLVKDQLELGG